VVWNTSSNHSDDGNIFVPAFSESSGRWTVSHCASTKAQKRAGIRELGLDFGVGTKQIKALNRQELCAKAAVTHVSMSNHPPEHEIEKKLNE
jgi:hypothetical protein